MRDQPTSELAESANAHSVQRLVSEQRPMTLFEPTDAEWVCEMNLAERVARAIALLKLHEPANGYYLAFSGGKDSCAIKKLAQLAGVKFESEYNSTTIDPPELIRFLKAKHPDVRWSLPEHGNMMKRVAEKSALPPTRMMRWCCEEYKEYGGEGRTKIMGVRTAESPSRKKRWVEVTTDHNKDTVVCPIVHWSDEQLWEFVGAYEVEVCLLYEEGWTRLGCVGCPLNNQSRLKEFERWPAFERNWKKAVIANWERWRNVPRNDGKPRAQSRFKTGEEMWQWWMQENRADPHKVEACQSELLWTNVDEEPTADALLANDGAMPRRD